MCIWNNLPAGMVNSSSLQSLKTQAKSHFSTLIQNSAAAHVFHSQVGILSFREAVPTQPEPECLINL